MIWGLTQSPQHDGFVHAENGRNKKVNSGARSARIRGSLAAEWHMFLLLANPCKKRAKADGGCQPV